jgi:hypothetical protein
MILDLSFTKELVDNWPNFEWQFDSHPTLAFTTISKNDFFFQASVLKAILFSD